MLMQDLLVNLKHAEAYLTFQSMEESPASSVLHQENAQMAAFNENNPVQRIQH